MKPGQPGEGVNVMQALQDLEYGFVSTVDVSFEDAVNRLEAGLKKEGLGVLCK